MLPDLNKMRFVLRLSGSAVMTTQNVNVLLIVTDHGQTSMCQMSIKNFNVAKIAKLLHTPRGRSCLRIWPSVIGGHSP